MPEPRGSSSRAGLRLTVRPSTDPRDVGARLDRALLAASRDRAGRVARQTRPVQVVGHAHHDPETYRRWRADQLRRVSGAVVPELSEGEWAMVLWAVPPTALVPFARDGSTRVLLGPPLVGTFVDGVEHEVAMAAALASWLQGRHEVVLAPPLLSVGGSPYGMLALKRGWPLPVAELFGLQEHLDVTGSG